ncbi:phage prohead protease, HK97 family [Anopheles sinensis]|uniref:Phage prohead protease, HK97 family n=1 Tax=Anopheles sinensis TaxID=74873 RepID=A0A084WU56_ANOSI|nr:phage prohead protease, HK97 family [Anopheles sinensis]
MVALEKIMTHKRIRHALGFVVPFSGICSVTSCAFPGLGHPTVRSERVSSLSTVDSPRFSMLDVCGLRLRVLSEEQFHRCHWN